MPETTDHPTHRIPPLYPHCLPRSQEAGITMFLCPDPGRCWDGSKGRSHALASSSRLAPPWITLAAQHDPAVLVGSGESFKEAFDVHQRGSGSRHPGRPVFHRGCGSCTEGKGERLGPQERAESLLAVGLTGFSGESPRVRNIPAQGLQPSPHLLTHPQSPWAAGSVGSAGTPPVWAAPWGVRGLPHTFL